MAAADQFLQCLEAGDVDMLLRIWSETHPHLPPPANREQAKVQMHLARTAANRISMDRRAYSHAWLTERLLPSQLPDHLRPKAQRIYPVVVEAVGVASMSGGGKRTEANKIITARMSDAVADAYANGDTDPVLVKSLILDARTKARKFVYG